MSEESADARPLTSVELLDAAVWREIGSEEAQPPAAFLEALSQLVGRWLLVRSDAPAMDVMTVLCKARGYIARQETTQTKEIEWGT
jgi:adenylate cyclase